MANQAAPGGVSGMDRALEAYAAVTRGPGLVAVLSDYFDETSSGSGLQALVHRGLTPVVVQIVAPEELEPALADDTELVDVEDDARAPLVVDPAAVEAYRRRMDEHSDALRSMCRSRGLTWMRIESDTSFKDMLAGFDAAGLFDR